jgi:potassium-dependent mechanosensitive channel
MRLTIPGLLLACALAWAGPALAQNVAATNALAAAPVAVPAKAAIPPPAPAAPALAPAPPPSADAIMAADQETLTQLTAQAAIVSNDARLATMGARAATIQAQARAALAAATAQIVPIDQQLAKVTPKGRRAPTAAEKAKQAPLLAQRAALRAQASQASAVVTAAEDAYEVIAERRREGFSARILTRSDSPLSPGFWGSLGDAAETDGQRLEATVGDAVSTPLRAPEPRGLIGLGAALLFALVLLIPVRRWLEKLGRRKTGESVHPGFAHTGAALWVAAVDTGAPTLATAALHLGAQWGGLLSPEADALAGAAVTAVAWASGIVALGRVLATEKDTSQRLLPLPDDTARRMGLPLRIVALVTGAGFMLTRLNYVAGASVAATIAANCALSLAYAAVAGLILISFGREPRREAATADAAPAGEAHAERFLGPIWTLISLILAAAIVVTLGAVLAGYTTLAALTSGQIFWLSIIAAATYLLMRFVDDLTTAVFSPRGWASRSLYQVFNFRRSTIGQAGVLISAALQLMILVAAICLALTPFGSGGDLLATHLSSLAAPISLGSATISPAAIAAGVATFIVGLGAARTVQRWIVRRYLPVTDWDSGVRNSVTTGVGYIGVCAAVLCALAATGLGFSQIALIASALSVGIGFGLQQVVQNFVSGIILLVERPVKVGDRVCVGGVEGDIRRIRVRATDIETIDHVTVIVPNSDLIAKPVENRTLGQSRSLVKLQLSITDPAQVREAREIILGLATNSDELAQTPAPEVHIQSLAAAGGVNLDCLFYARDLKTVQRLRSDCYFLVIDALRQNGIAFAGIAAA